MITIKSIQITDELLNLLSEVDEFKGAWRALGTLAPEKDSMRCDKQLPLRALALLPALKVAN
jgi:hypothetical protein